MKKQREAPSMEDLQKISAFGLQNITTDQLDTLKEASDDVLLRASTSLDLFAVAELNRRLKNALHKEEKAIKRLTCVLVILTLILVVLTIVLVFK